MHQPTRPQGASAIHTSAHSVQQQPLALIILIAVSLCSVLIGGCDASQPAPAPYPDVDRNLILPPDIHKRTPETDQYPPMLHSKAFAQPVPLPAPVNTAGGEDSPFILPDGKTLYFFFTPDVRVPPQEQLLDDVTGIWVTYKIGDTWSEPARVWLQNPGVLALDGAPAVQANVLWFASAREGYEGLNIFTAKITNDTWENWGYAGDRLMREIQIGEVHPHGDDLYFHSDRPGGQGQYDIWVTTRAGETWTDPVPITVVNTPEMDGFPFVSADGMELWLTRTYQGTPAIFRSRSVGGNWAEPELIVSQFAGEPTLDDAGNLYFVHHFFEDGQMIEADIYYAEKIAP